MICQESKPHPVNPKLFEKRRHGLQCPPAQFASHGACCPAGLSLLELSCADTSINPPGYSACQPNKLKANIAFTIHCSHLSADLKDISQLGIVVDSPNIVKSVFGTGLQASGKTSSTSWTVEPNAFGYCSVHIIGISKAAAPLTSLLAASMTAG